MQSSSKEFEKKIKLKLKKLVKKTREGINRDDFARHFSTLTDTDIL